MKATHKKNRQNFHHFLSVILPSNLGPLTLLYGRVAEPHRKASFIGLCHEWGGDTFWFPVVWGFLQAPCFVTHQSQFAANGRPISSFESNVPLWYFWHWWCVCVCVCVCVRVCACESVSWGPSCVSRYRKGTTEGAPAVWTSGTSQCEERKVVHFDTQWQNVSMQAAQSKHGLAQKAERHMTPPPSYLLQRPPPPPPKKTYESPQSRMDFKWKYHRSARNVDVSQHDTLINKYFPFDCALT